MATIGIDIGAYHHAVAFCRDGQVEADRKVLRISADRDGFAALDALLAAVGPVERVALESSGHYWFGIASHLAQQGVPVAVLNPLASTYFAKRRLQRAKSDPADARTLAALAMVDRPRTKEPWPERSCARPPGLRWPWSRSRPGPASGSFVSSTSASPSSARRTTTRAASPRWPCCGSPRRREPPVVDGSRASRRPGPPVGGPSGRRRPLRSTPRHSGPWPHPSSMPRSASRWSCSSPGTTSSSSSSLRPTRGSPRSSTRISPGGYRRSPGSGAATAAALIAEIGDIFRFDDFDQLVAFAGVHAAERSSGQKGADPATSWHMAKTGDAYLRAALYRIALVGTVHNPVIRHHYQRKRAQGKSKMNALGHCMKKTLAIVWGVWRSGHDFVVPEGIRS